MQKLGYKETPSKDEKTHTSSDETSNLVGSSDTYKAASSYEGNNAQSGIYPAPSVSLSSRGTGSCKWSFIFMIGINKWPGIEPYRIK
ncbi:hypothetical protein N7537_007180 [Penicillium hordei]|uniref:Uncharacterized protein n=1 Tax=Penicillium hordei TaxID=40994 RepID=A0AAD6H5W7_9EURO|nr:uncharacterized protein N7537_007180 [Penicillium hordei]KAJ5604224.1 hypothetical protein N7537_007180 [Penicillium hordei]